jgi:hypothetical protein
MEHISMTHYEFEIIVGAPLDYVFEGGRNPDNQVRCTPSMIDMGVIEETDEGSSAKHDGDARPNHHWRGALHVDSKHRRTTSIFDDGDMSGERVFEYTETDTGTAVRVVGDVAFGTSLFERAIQPVVTR